VRLRSDVVREDAHRFYEAIGYETRATSFVLHKVLEARGPGAP
jgi:hypothetical protein